MNDTIHNFLLFAFGLLITVGLIGLAVYYYNTTTEHATRIHEHEEAKLLKEEEYIITKYEDIDISGASVVSYAKEIRPIVTVIIDNGVASNTITSSTDSSIFTTMKDSTPSNRYYVDPTDSYTVNVHRNENGIIDKVIITKK